MSNMGVSAAARQDHDGNAKRWLPTRACLAKSLFQMLRQVLVHLEHGDLVATEDGFQLGVGDDLALVRLILKGCAS